MDLKSKTVLITGATGGIGSVLTSKFAAAGAHLILLGRDENKLANLGQPLGATTYVCNLADKESRQETIHKITSNHSHMDILVNNAGIGYYDNLDEIDSAEWYESYELNVHAPLFLTKGLLSLLQRSSQSLVMNIGSVAGYTSKPGRSTYNSTKFALRGMTLCLAIEYSGKNPQFTHIALDSVMTAFGPWTMEQKKDKAANGKVYLDPDWVGSQLIEIAQKQAWDSEYTLSTLDYGFGTWLKP